jgi:tyrosyl-tRNA synthetase
MGFIDNLLWRGLIQDISDPESLKRLSNGDRFYIGFDPTAPSLQLGNLVPMIVMIHLGQAGLAPIMLFGGATGAIGDPSGKSAERPLLHREEIERNILSQQTKAQEIFERCQVKVAFVNNYDWTGPIGLIEFLREIGKHFTVNYMIAKEVVKARLEAEGISFTEFSYMLLQANDFLHLYKAMGCKMQAGGSDQWGNITAGLELIRRKIQGDACAFSVPLLTDSQGKKFGKSEGGALWLDPAMTSPYRLHQFFLNVADQDVVKLLKVFTFMREDEIAALGETVSSAPEKREAQRLLADSVCTLVHGEQATRDAKRGAEVLFGGSLEGLSRGLLEEIFREVPSSSFAREQVSGFSFVDLLAECGMMPSRGEAKKLIKNGGAYLNNQRIADINLQMRDNPVLDSGLFVIRTGKKSYHLIRVTT